MTWIYTFRINLYRKSFEFDRYGVVNPRKHMLQEEEPVYELNRENSHKTFEDLPISDRLLVMLYENNRMTQEELSEQLGVSLRTVKRLMRTLQDEGRLSRKGNKRSGYWVVNIDQ